MNKKSLQDIIVVGFALFAMFFGAGNLIFPPSLGLAAGDSWLPAMIGFAITGIGLPLLGVIAVSRSGGSIDSVGRYVGKTFAKVFSIVIILSIGPLFAIPRTAATTFEMGVEPFIGTASKLVVALVSVVFFAIVLYFSINPSTVIDKVGKILTPCLLIALLVIIFKGIFTPLGQAVPTGIEGAFGKGFTEGYNTMDAIASLIFAGIVIKYFVEKGYKDPKAQVSLAIKAGIVSSIGFVIIYGGLCYIGSTASGIYPAGTDQTALTIGVVKGLLGVVGQGVLSIAVSLACLTTAIGLTTTCSEYFSKLTKIDYKKLVIGVCVFSAVMSVFGVSTLVKISVPVLVLLYPIATVLMVLNIFDSHIKNKNVYTGAVVGAFIVSIFDSLTAMNLPIESVNNMIKSVPFLPPSLVWIIPSIIGILVSLLFKSKYKEA